MKIEDFHIEITGNANSASPWLIFLHGLLGSSANWRRITHSFESQYRILVYDQRGHGKSFRPQTGYGPENFSGDLKFIMDSKNIDRATLIGHSMGGRNAQKFNFKFPDRVERLVIEDIGPGSSEIEKAYLIEKLKKVPVPFKDRVAAKIYLMGEFGDAKLGSFLYTNLVVDSDGQVKWKFSLEMVEEILRKGRSVESWNEFAAIKNPILVIRGERSLELLRPEFEKMLAINLNAVGEEIRGGTHWVHFDQPDLFIQVVQKFIQ